MSEYTLAVILLFLAVVAQSVQAVVGLRAGWRGRSRGVVSSGSWLAYGWGAALLAWHDLRQLRLALTTGLYDFPQSLLLILVAATTLLAIWGFRRESVGTPPLPL